MNILNKTVTILTLMLATSSLTASEGWFGKAGAITVGDSEGGVSIDLNGIYVGAGYSFKTSENFYVAPEVRLVKGVGSDDLLGVDFEIDTAWFAGAKGIYKADSGFIAFVSLGYGGVTIDGSFGGITASASTDEIVYGAGIGYEFNEHIAIEFSFEDFDGADVFQLGTNFRF